MQADKITLLTDRGVVRVTGEDATSFLDNLVTNDLEGMAEGEARFAALLTPQGKILFDFLVVRTADGYLLDIARDKAAELVKRLVLYKLRAKVMLEDCAATYTVGVAWDGSGGVPSASIPYRDPRAADAGQRFIAQAQVPPPARQQATDGAQAFWRHLIALGIPEGGRDYAFGDAFPHEANMDRLQGVSFSKGCFVGQEVVARMQHKTVVRKRITRVTGASPLVAGAEVKAGEATIGTVGSVAGNEALAMVRLDRAIEALDKGEAITAGGVPIIVDPAALNTYRVDADRKSDLKAQRL